MRYEPGPFGQGWSIRALDKRQAQADREGWTKSLASQLGVA
jgi:hypothetical protein